MTGLPVASIQQVRAHAWRITRRYPHRLAAALASHALASSAGLATPWLIGHLVADLSRGFADVNSAVLKICAAVVAQAMLTGLALDISARLGERVLADLREQFVVDVLALRPSAVQRAGRGDLVTRTTRDVALLSYAIRQAVPEILTALTMIVVTVGAVAVLGPLLAVPFLIVIPPLAIAARWYLARARIAYLTANSAYSSVATRLTETVEGAGTVEALALADRQAAALDGDIAASNRAERYTSRLRTVFFPLADAGYLIPLVLALILGGVYDAAGLAGEFAVVAAIMYAQQLHDPVNRLLYWMDELQAGGAAMARLLGVAPAAGSATSTPVFARTAVDGDIVIRDLRYAYRPGTDVLDDVNLGIKQGERIAVVGPSGAGKSTLGLLLAGIETPRTGRITIGGMPLDAIPADMRRHHIAMVTQERHVFHGTIEDNLTLVKPGAAASDLKHALTVAGAWPWVEELGLGRRVGPGGVRLNPVQAQELALARLVLLDPATVVFDEATSLLDPRSARTLERTLSAVLAGRTVIAIAHRLHTAHDADRVVVMDRGRIAELGTHDELLSRNGQYAQLWRSWQQE